MLACVCVVCDVLNLFWMQNSTIRLNDFRGLLFSPFAMFCAKTSNSTNQIWHNVSYSLYVYIAISLIDCHPNRIELCAFSSILPFAIDLFGGIWLNVPNRAIDEQCLCVCV